jgi:hypothetical protein
MSIPLSEVLARVRILYPAASRKWQTESTTSFSVSMGLLLATAQVTSASPAAGERLARPRPLLSNMGTNMSQADRKASNPQH